MSTSETPARAVDKRQVREFAMRMFDMYSQGLLSHLVELGRRTGLFEAAARGPATSAELAERAGLTERYVREWLGAMVTGGLFEYDAGTRAYTLPPAHALCLTGGGAKNMAPMAGMVPHLGKHLAEMEQVFRHGGGVPYATFRPEFTGLLDEMHRRPMDELLVDVWLPLLPGLAESLRAGAVVADVGCGTGHALNLLARAFPESRFVGLDIAEDAITLGRAAAREAGLGNVEFRLADAAGPLEGGPFDVVFAFDAVHDQADPAGVLGRIHQAVRPGGRFVMVDMAASSNLEENVGNPFASYIYAVSTLHCLTVSLAEGGAGLGAAWGEQTARSMLADAGFGEVSVRPAPGQVVNSIYDVARD
jgi:SAM-dependent methyltransferase